MASASAYLFCESCADARLLSVVAMDGCSNPSSAPRMGTVRASNGSASSGWPAASLRLAKALRSDARPTVPPSRPAGLLASASASARVRSASASSSLPASRKARAFSTTPTA